MADPDYSAAHYDTDLSDIQPSRPARHPLMMVGLMVVSVMLMWMYLEETQFYLHPPEPVDSGDTTMLRSEYMKDPTHKPDGLVHNAYVTITGLTGFRTLTESNNKAFIKLFYAPVFAAVKPEPERARTTDVAEKRSVTGRVLDLTTTSRYLAMQRYYADRFGLPTSRAFLILEGEAPKDYSWVLAIQGVLGLIFGINLWMLLRSLKR